MCSLNVPVNLEMQTLFFSVSSAEEKVGRLVVGAGACVGRGRQGYMWRTNRWTHMVSHLLGDSISLF